MSIPRLVRRWGENGAMNVDGLEVQVVRKPIKNMYLRVKPPDGNVVISAPKRMRDKDIAAFVRARHAWIEANQSKIRANRRQDPAQSTVWTDELRRQAAANINATLPSLLARWETIIGKAPTRITLRAMTSRWGSCTPRTGRIRLNLQLGLLDERFLEYVLVHELTHLWERGHGAGFQRRMNAYLPNWKQLRRELNRQNVRYTND